MDSHPHPHRSTAPAQTPRNVRYHRHRPCPPSRLFSLPLSHLPISSPPQPISPPISAFSPVLSSVPFRHLVRDVPCLRDRSALNPSQPVSSSPRYFPLPLGLGRGAPQYSPFSQPRNAFYLSSFNEYNRITATAPFPSSPPGGHVRSKQQLLLNCRALVVSRQFQRYQIQVS